MLAALLALPGAAAAQAGAPLESQASGLFINAAGQVLTAAHAVTGCASLYALKDGQVRRATVVARDDARPGLAGYRFQAPSERDLRGHARGQRRPARSPRPMANCSACPRAQAPCSMA